MPVVWDVHPPANQHELDAVQFMRPQEAGRLERWRFTTNSSGATCVPASSSSFRTWRGDIHRFGSTVPSMAHALCGRRSATTPNDFLPGFSRFSLTIARWLTNAYDTGDPARNSTTTGDVTGLWS